jgi:ABC-type lipoprotein export system ATPase subunit
MRPTEGAFAWAGAAIGPRPHAYRRALGYLPQRFDFYSQLSAVTFLRYVAALKGLDAPTGRDRVAALVERLGLAQIADQRMGGYPHAMRWRVGLAQAVLNDPALLLLDEPAAELAAEERQAFYDLLREFVDRRLVIVATDRANDVASFATHVALLRAGRLLDLAGAGAAGQCVTPDWLVTSARDVVWSVAVDQNAFVEIRRTALLSQVAREGGRVHLRIVAPARPHPDAVRVAPTLDDACAYHIHTSGEGASP